MPGSFYPKQILTAAELNAATAAAPENITVPMAAADVKLVLVPGDMIPIQDSEAAGALKRASIDAVKAASAVDASTVNYSPAGTGAVASTVQAKLRKLITDGDYGTVAQAKTIAGLDYRTIYNPVTIDRDSIKEGMTVTGSINGASVFIRAYTDTTNFQSSVTGGYTSYDTTAAIGNGSTDPHYNHSYGYEARHTFQGANGIDNLFGFYSGMTVNGAQGTGSLAAVINNFGFAMGDAVGTGTIYRQSAFYSNDLTRGQFNDGLYLGISSGANKKNLNIVGTADNYLKGNTQIDGAVTLGSDLTMTKALANITLNGQTRVNLAASSNLVLTGGSTIVGINSMNDAMNAYQPLALNASVILPNTYIRQKTYTVATLPSASAAGSGADSFVTDATATTFASIVAGGGANAITVYSDGTNWRIG